MAIKVIFAIGTRGEFGHKNGLPWGHNKVDIAHFAKYTEGESLVMGKNTYESLPESKLPGREKVIVSRGTPAGKSFDDTYFAHNVEDLKVFLKEWEPHTPKGNFVVIGGPQIILEALDVADEVSISMMYPESGPFNHDVSMDMGLLNVKLYSRFRRAVRIYEDGVFIEIWEKKKDV